VDDREGRRDAFVRIQQLLSRTCAYGRPNVHEIGDVEEQVSHG
jgi:hypothetical protein